MVNAFDVSTTDALDPAIQAIVRRRARVLGPGYKLFYKTPLELVRGEGVYMYDAQGNRYLDAYNNVPSAGHCHPHVVKAVSDQMAKLNTHTRYAAEPILDYSERLLATFPAEMDNVMFTCTGSEAVDLALRISRFYTQGTGVIVTANAYHGLTTAAAEISPQLGANVPVGQHVWTVAAPQPDRTDGVDPGEAFAAGVAEAIADMQRHGVGFAAFIADSLFSTDGILPDPAGFLQPTVNVVHAAGGLYIADEVQPGFARTGDTMWGFQRHGIVPDIAVMGKPMGNGMPIAGVVVKSAILDEFGTKVRYFNTFGGNSVSIAAAAAVLDVIENEGLQENSQKIGRYLKEELEQLASGSDNVSAVRGAGLYLAVDFVDEAGLPAADAASDVINGLRQRGVLIGGTGMYGNTLKIRPLLPFTHAHANEFLHAFDDTLAAMGRNRPASVAARGR
ncbi:aspartate aminotransferase family protein (plasmid) [Arthrobacter sp. UC242_113]|uniref:aspartate aminotransferase family protein n=1 Tax=Arthrobacter sp. UC242_113 TaxID=3374550 RepID=UPI0037571904